MNLDQTQLAAAESHAPRRIIAANPGAGKTRVAIASILHAIKTGANPHEIVAFTFTNAGAHEMAVRLGNVKLNFIGTIHGYCFRLLHQHGKAIGYREGGINMVNEVQSWELLKAAAAHLKYKGSDKALREARDPQARLAHQRHQWELKRSNLVDYDGVLREALALLAKIEIPRPALLVLDEAQDSALVDWEIVEAINPVRFLVVGDSDQSIFSFRGAYPQGFLDKWNDPTFEQHKLERNYRSGAVICRAAESLISHNTKRVQKRILPKDDAEPGGITACQYPTDAQEREAIARHVAQKIHDGTNPSDIAILCRTNRLAKQFKDALLLWGVADLRHSESTLTQDFGYAMDVLSLFADPRSDILAERVLKRYAPDMISKLKSEAARDGSWLSSVAAFENVTPIPNHPMTIAGVPADLLKWRVSRETCELIGSRIALLLPESTLADLRHDLFNADKWNLTEGKKDGVYCGTIHSFKGKEAPVVFLPGWEQGVLPSSRKDTDTEEDRRLAFVGITRAARECHISAATTRVQEFGPPKVAPMSEFVREAGL